MTADRLPDGHGQALGRQPDRHDRASELLGQARTGCFPSEAGSGKYIEKVLNAGLPVVTLRLYVFPPSCEQGPRLKTCLSVPVRQHQNGPLTCANTRTGTDPRACRLPVRCLSGSRRPPQPVLPTSRSAA